MTVTYLSISHFLQKFDWTYEQKKNINPPVLCHLSITAIA